MKTQYLLLALIIPLLSFSCEDEDSLIDEQCGTHAIVEDWTGLDGCGYLVKLDNGEYLEPIIMGYCATPPISEEQKNDPLSSFAFMDGQEVMINYEVKADYGSICMKGTTVKITCIQEITPGSTGDL